jgi:hypothetical protein
MIPDDDEYLSLLMGAPSISDVDLASLGIEILQRFGSETRGLRIPGDCLAEYRQLVRQRMTPGFWNDLVGRDAIYFLFKLADGTVKDFTLSEANKDEIAALCSALNGDPIETTSDLPRYLASNPFYRDAMVGFRGVS